MIENVDDTQRPLQDWHHDARSNEELLHGALTEQDEDLAWHAIGTLQLRGSPETFEAARQLCASADVRERRVGADILGQLGMSKDDDSKFHDESVILLLGMLEGEQEPCVLNSIAVALGHRRDPRTLEPLVHLKNHPDAAVREGVAYGLSTYEDERAIATLIELSVDVDSDVRDWATFGLGSMIETDTPAIRDALLARTTDEDGDTRGEAMVGLARRHDKRVVEILLAELEAGWYGSLLFEAATEIADPRLYPALVELREGWDEDKIWPYNLLEDAIEACQPASEG